MMICCERSSHGLHIGKTIYSMQIGGEIAQQCLVYDVYTIDITI